jgi:hypothetical protein
MAADTPRSEQVVENFKKHKLAISAFRRIQSLILGFDKDRQADARIARVGLGVLLVVIALAAYFFLSADSITIS